MYNGVRFICTIKKDYSFPSLFKYITSHAWMTYIKVATTHFLSAADSYTVTDRRNSKLYTIRIVV